MLSYRHAYHAGGPADVLKHAVLAFVLDHATRRPRPLYVLDTHAGAGAYDLASAMATKTGEAEAGVERLRHADLPWPDLLEPYRALLAASDAYPGSPAIALAFLRPGDRIELVELHPTDHAALAERCRGLPRVRVTRADGLVRLQGAMPPLERRAVVLIDPSYEIKADYEAVPAALVAAHRRFASGTYILWYPVIDRARTVGLLDALRASGIPAQYRIELGLLPDGARRGMTGSGLVVINPPPGLPQAAARALPWLAARLDATGPLLAEWLVPA